MSASDTLQSVTRYLRKSSTQRNPTVTNTRFQEVQQSVHANHQATLKCTSAFRLKPN